MVAGMEQEMDSIFRSDFEKTRKYVTLKWMLERLLKIEEAMPKEEQEPLVKGKLRKAMKGSRPNIVS
jgi:hypothetical protein